MLKLGNDVDQLWLAYRREDEFVTSEVRFKLKLLSAQGEIRLV